MIEVVGVRFRKAGKVYYFSPGDLAVDVGQSVIVETVRGMELGEVAMGRRAVAEGDVTQPLKPVVRLATSEDLHQANANCDEEGQACEYAQVKIQELGLEMKLVDVEYTFDKSKLVFYFTADKRVDFRELVKELAARFRTRIELRQIGVRDEAKMLGGLGVCGQCLCCSSWIGDFAPVSIRHAKEQELSMNPSKISGLCGRLKCCLRFEAEAYEDAHCRQPKIGSMVTGCSCEGQVVAINLLREKATVQLAEGTRVTMSWDELKTGGPAGPKPAESAGAESERHDDSGNTGSNGSNASNGSRKAANPVGGQAKPQGDAGNAGEGPEPGNESKSGRKRRRYRRRKPRRKSQEGS
jgi:cell fate regulator YaaT (PSP1 superfamily)